MFNKYIYLNILSCLFFICINCTNSYSKEIKREVIDCSFEAKIQNNYLDDKKIIISGFYINSDKLKLFPANKLRFTPEGYLSATGGGTTFDLEKDVIHKKKYKLAEMIEANKLDLSLEWFEKRDFRLTLRIFKGNIYIAGSSCKFEDGQAEVQLLVPTKNKHEEVIFIVKAKIITFMVDDKDLD